jgi:hypothetical protein
VTPVVLQSDPQAEDALKLSNLDELRAQYVAASYLSTACQEALGSFPPPAPGDDDRIAQRALEYILAIEYDWRNTLQGLGEQIARATCERTRHNGRRVISPR